MPLHPVGFWSDAGGTVTLSGESVSVNGALADAGIRFNSDGTVDKVENGTYTQVDSSTDWIIPNGAASSLYDVRITNVVDIGGSPEGFNHASAAAEDVWINLGANREWAVENVGTGGSSSVGYTFDVEIRYNGGSVLDSASYTVLSEDI